MNVLPEQQTTGSELVGGIVCIFCCIYVLGVRDLARVLQDPFGDDLQDLSVLHYVNDTILMSRRILLSLTPETCTETEEFVMDADRPTLGPGFG